MEKLSLRVRAMEYINSNRQTKLESLMGIILVVSGLGVLYGCGGYAECEIAGLFALAAFHLGVVTFMLSGVSFVNYTKYKSTSAFIGLAQLCIIIVIFPIIYLAGFVAELYELKRLVYYTALSVLFWTFALKGLKNKCEPIKVAIIEGPTPVTTEPVLVDPQAFQVKTDVLVQPRITQAAPKNPVQNIAQTAKDKLLEHVKEKANAPLVGESQAGGWLEDAESSDVSLFDDDDDYLDLI